MTTIARTLPAETPTVRADVATPAARRTWRSIGAVLAGWSRSSP